MELDCILKALGEPMRLKIYQAILERKHCVRSLSKKFGISESAISQHLKIMREAGLVYGEKYGYHMHYLPDQEAIVLRSRWNRCGGILCRWTVSKKPANVNIGGKKHETESAQGFVFDFCPNRTFYLWGRVCHDFHDRAQLCGRKELDHP